MSKAATRPPRGARDILRHYLDNPQTADSLEGIAGWRLIDQIVRRRVMETQRALKWLVDQAFLERKTREATPPMYRLKVDRRADAERLLKRRAPRASATRRRRRRP